MTTCFDPESVKQRTIIRESGKPVFYREPMQVRGCRVEGLAEVKTTNA